MLIMMNASEKSKSCSNGPEVRVVYVYCLMLFDKSSCKSRVWTYDNTDELINDLMSLRADTTLFPSTFVHKMLVTSGHPLFEHAQPLFVRHKEVILPK